MASTQTLTLTEFLLARIAEDEAAARDADEGDLVHRYARMTPDLIGAHIVRWDPRRVLAECEAKRRVLALHDLDPDERVDHECGEVEHNWPCPTLRLIVLPYVDHPDFRPEWAWT